MCRTCAFGMVHARVVRPPSYGARFVASNAGCEKCRACSRSCATAASLPSSRADTRRSRRCSALVGRGEMEGDRDGLPKHDDLATYLTACRRKTTSSSSSSSPAGRRAGRIEADVYAGPIRRTDRSARPAPSRSSVDGTMTVWTHTQGVFPAAPGHRRVLRLAAGEGPLHHVEGSGCYGHNGADDAAADAALIARALPGGRCACSGCAKRSMPGSRYGRRW